MGEKYELDDLINSRVVRRMCGNIVGMTLYRWMRRDFPQRIVIARRNYWRRGDIVRWLEEKAARA